MRSQQSPKKAGAGDEFPALHMLYNSVTAAALDDPDMKGLVALRRAIERSENGNRQPQSQKPQAEDPRVPASSSDVLDGEAASPSPAAVSPYQQRPNGHQQMVVAGSSRATSGGGAEDGSGGATVVYARPGSARSMASVCVSVADISVQDLANGEVEPSEENFDAVFSYYDIDKSGWLDEDYVVALYCDAEKYGMPREMADREARLTLRQYESGLGVGKVTRDQFAILLLRLYQQ